MTTTSFLRGAKCRLGACDEVGEGNQERRVVSNSRQTPDCRVMRSSLIHGDPGFNWGSGSSKGRCIRRVWGARMGPEEFSTQIYSTKRRKKGAESAGARGFFDAHDCQCKLIYRKADISRVCFFCDWKKHRAGPGSFFLKLCEAETTNAPPAGAYSMFEFEPTKSWSFVSTHFGDLEIRRLRPNKTLMEGVMDKTLPSVEGCYLN